MNDTLKILADNPHLMFWGCMALAIVIGGIVALVNVALNGDRDE